MAKIITPREAAALIRDGMTVAVGGFGAYCAPDELLDAVARRYAEEGHPRGLTVMTGITPGNFDKVHGMGLSRWKADGLMDTIITAHMGNAPDIAALVGDNRIAGYTLPLGVVMHLYRAMAGKKPGVVTRVGLGTFADPRVEGCKANDRARAQGRDLVSLTEIGGEEYLFYKTTPMDLCIIRGTYADADGNISFAHEAVTDGQLQVASAVHNCGGTVIVQVEGIIASGTISPKQVGIPRKLVDYVVRARPEYHMQSYAEPVWRPELTGEIRVPADAIAPLPLTLRKVIARRGALELAPDCLINLGIGIPSGVGSVANEEGVADSVTLSLESGPLGGVPVDGIGFGGSVNAEAILTAPATFDLYDGGVLDMTFLGAAEIDERGNVNVSKFGNRATGPGGFINISQNTRKVCFMLSFTAGDLRETIGGGRLTVDREGDGQKFVKTVRQITFSGDTALKNGQEVLYITERAVFRLTERGVTLTEVAPGIDPEKDIFPRMGFRPAVAEPLKQMDPRLFRAEKMGLTL